MLRVLTLNIWNLGGDWRARRQAILSVIRSCEADVVCLQEVVEAGGKNQARWLARELGDWSCTYGGEPGYGLDDFVFGNAVLARWPATDTAVGRLPHEPHEREVQRLAVHARVDGVDVFSTHLAWQLHDAALRERQVLAGSGAGPHRLHLGDRIRVANWSIVGPPFDSGRIAYAFHAAVFIQHDGHLETQRAHLADHLLDGLRFRYEPDRSHDRPQILEDRGFVEGSSGKPGSYVIEKAFVER